MVGVVRLFLRRLRAEPWTSVGVGGLVLVTAFLFAAAPRLLAATADDTLRTTVAREPVADRSLEFDEQDRILGGAADDPLAGAETEGAALQRALPDTLRSTISDRVLSIDTTRWSIVSPTAALAEMTIRFEPRAADHIRLSWGRLPAATDRTVVVPATTNDPEVKAPIYEVALAESSAAALRVGVGDTMLLRPSRFDPQAAGRSAAAAVEVVGVYTVPHPDDPFWYGEPALLRPTIRSISQEINFVDVFGLGAPVAYPTYLTETRQTALPLRYHWRLTVDIDRLQAGAIAQLQADLRRLQSTLAANALGAGGAVLSSALLPILVRQDAEWRSALAVLAEMWTGPAVIAAAAFALVALLAARWRRMTVGLWRARGASAPQVLAAVVAEAILLTVPPAVVAGLLAIAAIPGPGGALTLVGVALVALVAGLILAATLAPAVAGPGAAVGTRDMTRRPAAGRGVFGRRRLIVEAFVVALAAAAAWLLRQRTVHGSGGGGRVDLDPLVAVAPALVGAAVGLVALRLVPLPMELLGRAARGGRGLVPVLGLRRATRGGAGTAVLLVLLGTAMISTFASAALVLLDRSADAIAWHDVGAPVRIAARGGVLGATLDPTQAGAEVVSPAYRAFVGAGSVRTELLAVDPASYADVVAGLPVDAGLPAELSTPPGAAGTPGAPLPAVISTTLASDPAGIAAGATFNLVIDGRPTALRAIATRDAYPTLDPGGAFVIVARPQVEALHRSRLPTTDLFVRAPDSAVAAIRDLVGRESAATDLDGRTETAAALRDSPVVRSVRAGIALAVAVAASYAALAVVAALALSGAARATETGILRTFGLTRRDALGLVIAEHAPIVGIAFAGGVALGLGLFVALRPGLGLDGVVGSDVAVPFAIEPVHVALLLAYVAIVTIVGVGLAASIERRALLVAAVRRGAE